MAGSPGGRSLAGGDPEAVPSLQHCGGETPGTYGPFTSSCTAVPLTPLVVTPPGSPARYEFIAHTAPPGPASCCVIDTCAGVTMFDASQGTVTATYQEIGSVDPMTHDGNVSTGLGINCPVEIPSDVYARSDTYRINFHPDLRFTLPPEPDWAAPYVLSAGDLSVSIDSANTHPSDVTNSFTPATWRLVDETASVDKVCAEQNLMQGHATVSFVKNDGTPCTVTIYAQGTRTVGAQ